MTIKIFFFMNQSLEIDISHSRGKRGVKWVFIAKIHVISKFKKIVIAIIEEFDCKNFFEVKISVSSLKIDYKASPSLTTGAEKEVN